MRYTSLFAYFLGIIYCQYDYSLEDLNPSSEYYGDSIGVSYFSPKVTLHYFGHYTWGTCGFRFEQLNELSNSLISENIELQLIGIGKATQLNSISNWTDDVDVPVCADPYPFEVWNEFEAGQRDLIILDKSGNIAYHNNITSGIPDSLENYLRSLSLLNTTNKIYTDKFMLHNNFPNPFNPSTSIAYSIPINSSVSLKIYSLLGKEIVTLVNEVKTRGEYSVQWDAKNDLGNKVTSGIYLYKLAGRGFSQTKKMILLK